MTKKRVALFGSTGSIGTQSLDVIRRFPEKFELVAITAHSSLELLVEQFHEFEPQFLALSNPSSHSELKNQLGPQHQKRITDLSFEELIEETRPDIVINALVGAAGLGVTRSALECGLRLGLANKESLIMAGELVMDLAQTPGAELIPIDSEHSAIFQCLLGEKKEEVSKIWLTASGGPFFGKTRNELLSITPAQALKHPTWSMGAKISIDSSTLMNKGLEVIEAHFLFDASYDQIVAVIHPQSVIHSLVEYVDGTFKAHLGVTDMRIPIQYALSYPKRFASPVKDLDLRQLSNLEFASPDLETFGCLALAYEAGRAGGTAAAIMNAANEVAVAAFLSERLPYLGIEETIDAALDSVEGGAQDSFDAVLDADARSRRFSENFITSR